MSKWVGYAVSVRCGSPLGCYQGTIVAADGASVTLTKAFRNGFPYPKAQVTLNAADIKSLSIIEAAPEYSDGGAPAEPGAGGGSSNSSRQHKSSKDGRVATAAASSEGRQEGAVVGLPRKARQAHHRATVCESLQGAGAGAGAGRALRGRDAAAFGGALSPVDAEFDFQSNLLLFDKRALTAALNARPDVVPAPPRDYRHDQNVLGAPPKPTAIQVPLCASGGGWYVSDCGRRVPALLGHARAQLWTALQRCGLQEAALVLLARAAADLALKLLGGARRLEPRNAHQPPAVAVLAGDHRAGRSALQAARLLAAAGVSVVCCVPGGASGCLAPELGALDTHEVPVVPCTQQLPLNIDTVIVGIEQERELVQWAAGARCAVLAVEPPSAAGGGLVPRAAVSALLPLWPPPAAQRLHLADVGVPRALYRQLGVTYTSPFGGNTLLALHPADD